MSIYFLGLDLGGTNVKAGVVNAHGKLLAHVSGPTGSGGADLAASRVIGRMVDAARLAVEKAGLRMSDVAAAGVLSPGQASLSKGIIYRAANLRLWRNVPLRASFSRGIHLPAVLENDAHAAAYGEWWVGAGKLPNGRKLDSMFMFTLGTGVGGGLVYQGKVVDGSFDFATEVGHWIMLPHARRLGEKRCGCGQFGCLETFSSASYTGKRATHQLLHSKKIRKRSSLGKVLYSAGKVTAADVAQHAKAGDAFALSVWNETCYMLALACINVCHVVDPQMIVLGGGMSQAGRFLVDTVQKHVKGNWWRMTRPTAKITLAKLGNDAGVIGAAGVAKQAFELHRLPPIGK